MWQLTDDLYCDDLTCALVLKGGSFYAPIAAPTNASGPLPAGATYFPAAAAAANDRHLRLPALTEAAQRGAFTGFRCVADSAPSRDARVALLELAASRRRQREQARAARI